MTSPSDEIPDGNADETVDDANDTESADISEWSPFAADADAEQIDALYRQALEGMEAVEHEAQIATADESSPPHDELHETPVDSTRNEQPNDSAAETATTAGFDRLDAVNDTNRISPAKIVEAALFVGGTQLTGKNLRKLLGGNYPADFVEQTVDDLNVQYAEEKRPYEILFGEGGYRLALKSEYHRVRNRVFGVGPKEIRLSQDALETLSLVAYRQPVTPAEIDKLRGQPSAGTLRQLIRRELVALERDPENRKHVEYRSTPRFLEVFGLRHIDELPQADDLNFK